MKLWVRNVLLLVLALGLVVIPLFFIQGAEWGATGAAVAVLASTLVFAGAWLVVILRLREEVHAAGTEVSLQS